MYTCNVDHDQSSQLQTENSEKTTTEQSFFDMVNQYQDAIFRFVYFRTNNRAVAVDITQDTFTKTWLYINSGKRVDHPEAFFYRTAKNALIDWYKKSKSSSLDILIEDGFDPGSNETTDAILRDDDIVMTRDLLNILDEESRQIIYLRYSEEQPIEAIAEIYGKSPNAMTVQIHRIIKKLRSHYETIYGA